MLWYLRELKNLINCFKGVSGFIAETIHQWDDLRNYPRKQHKCSLRICI